LILLIGLVIVILNNVPISPNTFHTQSSPHKLEQSNKLEGITIFHCDIVDEEELPQKFTFLLKSSSLATLSVVKSELISYISQTGVVQLNS